MPLLAKINYYQLYNPWKYYCGAGRMFERARVLGARAMRFSGHHIGLAANSIVMTYTE